MSMCLYTKKVNFLTENFINLSKIMLDKIEVHIYNILRDLRSFSEVQYDY